MKIFRPIVTFFVFILPFVMFACGDRSEEVRSGVMYAKNALSAVGANPFSRASYEAVVARGGTPVDYIKSTLPKEKPVFDSWENDKPTHEWTIVIRPGTYPNEYSIEGYGRDLKKPIIVEHVTVNLSEPEETSYPEDPSSN